MAVSILDYSKQLSGTNPNSQLIVSGLSNPFTSSNAGFKATATTVVAVVAGQLNYRVSNEFGTPLWSQAQQALSETIGGFQAIGSSAKKALTGKGLSNPITLLNASQSVKMWTGSSLPIFTIPLKFVALNEDDDVTDAHCALLSSVGPTFKNQSGLSGFLRPPLGYQSSGLSASGTITIAIGQWFRSANQVMLSVDMTYSRETLLSGAPLYCEGSISFTPYRIISYTEMCGYFLDTTL